MVKAAQVVTLVIAFVAVMLVTRHVADAQPTGRTRRAGPNSGNSKNLVGRDPDPARMPPGEDKALPAGQAGALGRRADAFDASFKLVDDEVRCFLSYFKSSCWHAIDHVVVCTQCSDCDPPRYCALQQYYRAASLLDGTVTAFSSATEPLQNRN